MKTTKVSQEQLVDLLINYKRCAPITATIETVVKMNKNYVAGIDKKGKDIRQPNPYYGTVCRKRVNGMVNFDYGNSVNNQRKREDKEADFDPYQRRWGIHVTKSVIGHKGNFYLQIKLENSYDFTYSFEGSPIDYQVLIPFLPPKRKSTRQELDKEVEVRDVKVENIIDITIDKVKYTVER